MTIRCIYHGHQPQFPATDQHPDAKRYGPIAYTMADGRKCDLWIDAIGSEPTKAEIDAHFAPPPPMTVEAKLKAAGLTIAELKAALR